MGCVTLELLQLSIQMEDIFGQKNVPCFQLKLLTVLSCVTPVEAVLVDVVHRGVAGAVEETSLVVLMIVSLLHVALLDL